MFEQIASSSNNALQRIEQEACRIEVVEKQQRERMAKNDRRSRRSRSIERQKQQYNKSVMMKTARDEDERNKNS